MDQKPEGALTSAPQETVPAEPGDSQGHHTEPPLGPRPSWRHDGGALFLLLVGLLVMIVPTLGADLWKGHEELFPALRTYYLAEAWLATGRLHVPWLAEPAFGYGWPFFTFYAPLGYYVSSALHLVFPMGATYASSLSFHLSFVAGAFLMYGFARSLLRWYVPGITSPREAALWSLVAASLFTFAPYHLTDVFMRSSLAQSWSWATCVGYLWGLEYARRRPLGGTLLIAIAYCALTLSHNVIALCGTLFFGVYILATCGKNWRWILAAGFGGLWGALLCAYFWLPAFALLPLVRASQPGMMLNTPDSLTENALYFRQLFMETPGDQFSTQQLETAFGINPGYMVMALLVLGIGAFFSRERSEGGAAVDGPGRRMLGASLALALAAIIMVSPLMPWRHVPSTLLFVQFPWRLLLFVVLFVSLGVPLAAGSIRRWVHPGVLVGLILMIGAPSIAPRIETLYTAISDEKLVEWGKMMEAEKSNIIGCIQRDYLPLTARASFVHGDYRKVSPVPPQRLEVKDASTGFNLLEFGRLGSNYLYEYRASKETAVTLHMFAFPGWELLIDGVEAPDRLEINPDGLLRATLPAGEHRAEVRYTISPIGRLAMRITNVAWLLLAVALVGLLLLRRRADSN